MVHSVLISTIALGLEALLGYPAWLFRAAGHPVSWMGAALSWLERLLNRPIHGSLSRRFFGAGTLATLLGLSGTVGLLISTMAQATLPVWGASLVIGLMASTCLAQRSLDHHVGAVVAALERNGLPGARRRVGAIVGRDTAGLDESGVARAAIESLAENFADGVVAPAFWLALFGLPGALLYKAINTADSMIGHRTPRYADFGFAAAKIDDLVNWVPARMAAGWLLLAAAVTPGAAAREGWRVMWRDARGHPSPNAGWPEAAMAGALGVRLGGPRVYAGRLVADAYIGTGSKPVDTATIREALRIYRVACGLQIVAFAVLAMLIVQWI